MYAIDISEHLFPSQLFCIGQPFYVPYISSARLWDDDSLVGVGFERNAVHKAGPESDHYLNKHCREEMFSCKETTMVRPHPLGNLTPG